MNVKSDPVIIDLSSDDDGTSDVKTRPSKGKESVRAVLVESQPKPKRSTIDSFFTLMPSAKRSKTETRPVSASAAEQRRPSLDCPANVSDPIEIGESSNESLETNSSRSPYYLRSFWQMVDTIVGTSTEVPLLTKGLSPSDLITIKNLRLLSEDCQKLFIRLLSRQKWIARSKIDYENDLKQKGSTDLCLIQLVEHGLLFDRDSLNCVNEGLNQLPIADCKVLAKNFGIFPLGKEKNFKNKADIIKRISSMQLTMAAEIWAKKENRIVKNIRELLGQCYSVPKPVKRLFLRLFFLFARIADLSRQNNGRKSNSNGTESLFSQLFSMLEVDRGNVKFPAIEINPDKVQNFLDHIFRSPEELDQALWFYMKAEKLESKVDRKNKCFPIDLAAKIVSRYREVVKEDQALNELPKFMRSMALPSIAKRALFVCSDVYEAARKYDEAVIVLKLILEKNLLFAQSLRRKVWPRLILDQSKHLNDYQSAWQSAQDALNNDPALTLATRWEIEDRVLNDLKKKVDIGDFLPKIPLPEEKPVIVKSEIAPYEMEGRRIIQFHRRSNDGTVEYISVEEAAIDHYLYGDGHLFTEALHAEGGTILTLLGLIFYDIIYSAQTSNHIDGKFPVYVSKYQAGPLDLNSGRDFYDRRWDKIEQRLKLILEDDEEMSATSELISDIWSKHENESCYPVSWTVFKNVNQALRLVRALGFTNLGFLMKTVISDLHFFHSGFPDLTVWNVETRLVRFVEVKGPGDSLSPKQRIWLDLLRRNGLQAEVCRVEAVKSRKL